jgi:hypothetical protein
MLQVLLCVSGEGLEIYDLLIPTAFVPTAAFVNKAIMLTREEEVDVEVRSNMKLHRTSLRKEKCTLTDHVASFRDFQVRWEDQQQINEFGRLNTRLNEVRADKKALKVGNKHRTAPFCC